MSINLLALAASTRPNSLNKRLLKIAISHAKAAGANVTEFDYAQSHAPLYHGEPAPAIPAGITRLGDALKTHDGLLLASPEYNWSISGALKNIIDWLSIDPRKPLKGRGALLMCASPSLRGGILGLNQLSLPLAHLGMYVYPHLIAIGDAELQITTNGIASAKDDQFLTQCVTDFVRVTTSTAKG
ncbi:MAG: NADPH-dependent FMN reductase [Rickettsiales bacterium]